jgi:methylated-DNA-[protein]-cysteine S-methyltransferase
MVDWHGPEGILGCMNMEKARFAVFETAWGYAGFAAGTDGIVKLLLPVATRDIALARFSRATFDAALMKDVQKALRHYFEGRNVDFQSQPPVDTGCTSRFALAVLRECRNIKYGRRITYGELAGRAGKPKAARAVGTILARNPVPLIVPCHRVVRADGGLGGFSADGGISMKKRLLDLESHRRTIRTS